MKLTFSTLIKKLFFLISLSLPFHLQSQELEATFLFVGQESSQAYMGAKQGLKEANLQGEFLGQSYKLTKVCAKSIESHINDSVVAILVSDTKERFLNIANQFPDMVIFNLSLDDDDLRQSCSVNQFHTIPSKRMKDDALNQWLQKEPKSNAVAQAWHPDFKKFAARDLNKRFLKTNDEKMLDEGWAGWAAVKMVSDTIARENKVDAAGILNYLKNELAFDGQKGASLSFRNNGQLKQSILIVEGENILTEAPVRGVANPPTLDSLGITECKQDP